MKQSKERNQKIISLLEKRKKLPRDEIARLTQIPRTSVFSYLDVLIKDGQIEKSRSHKRHVKGRPSEFYELKTK
jgi:predicted ArsR family transcriptional regulator